jgi:hypothetical protein
MRFLSMLLLAATCLFFSSTVVDAWLSPAFAYQVRQDLRCSKNCMMMDKQSLRTRSSPSLPGYAHRSPNARGAVLRMSETVPARVLVTGLLSDSDNYAFPFEVLNTQVRTRGLSHQSLRFCSRAHDRTNGNR